MVLHTAARNDAMIRVEIGTMHDALYTNRSMSQQIKTNSDFDQLMSVKVGAQDLEHAQHACAVTQ